jgi:hypothetical protein
VAVEGGVLGCVRWEDVLWEAFRNQCEMRDLQTPWVDVYPMISGAIVVSARAKNGALSAVVNSVERVVEGCFG